ncbi:MAG: hypothetical protein ACR2OG_03100 [Gemmatimonadaceae bacterium]
MTMTLKQRLAMGTAVFALVACEHTDPVSVAGGERGAAQLVAGGATNANLPNGSISFTSLNLALDPANRDAFSRKPTTAVGLQYGRYFRKNGAQDLWQFPWDVSRNSSAARNDPRWPFLQSPTATIDADNAYNNALTIWQPESPEEEGGDNYYEPYTQLGGLQPGAVYVTAFVKRRLKVVGNLDQADRLINGTVTAPDSLLLATGAVVTAVTPWTNKAPVGCAPFPGPTTAAFVFDVSVADATGGVGFDNCFQGGNGIWTASGFGTRSLLLIAPDDDAAPPPAAFNYIEVWKTAFGTGTPVMRIQVGQDVDVSGNPVANTFSPFPAPNTKLFGSSSEGPPATDKNSAFPLTISSLIQLSGLVGTPNNFTVTLNNLQKKAQGVYKVWAINPTSGVAVPLAGLYKRTLNGVAVDSTTTPSSTFLGGPGTITFTVSNYLTQIAPKTASDSLRFFLVTNEDDAGATTPSLSQAVWGPIFKLPGQALSTTEIFGNFNVLPTAQDTSAPQKFVSQGSVSGGVLGDTSVVIVDSAGVKLRRAQFVGSILNLRFSNIARPPVGYEYRGFLVGKDTTVKLDVGVPTDANDKSLAVADTAANSSNLTKTGIYFAKIVYDVAKNDPSTDSICDYSRFRLYLQPKGSDVPPVYSIIFDVALPDRVTTAASCR